MYVSLDTDKDCELLHNISSLDKEDPPQQTKAQLP